MFRTFLLLATVLVAFAQSGPNEDAIVYFDAVAATDTTESVGPCDRDSTLVTAVRISGASSLYSYEFYISFDSASIAFVSGKRDNSRYTNFLELNDGSCSFSARLSRNDSTRILVGNFLSGNDNSQCVSDSGVLGLFTFRHKKDDSAAVTIDSIKLIDCDLEEDWVVTDAQALLVPSSDIPVRYRRVRKSPGATVAFRNGIVNVAFGKKTRYTAMIVTALGETVYSHAGNASVFNYAPSGRQRAGQATQMRILRIAYAGTELVVPLLY
jgi:hypothetical protein